MDWPMLKPLCVVGNRHPPYVSLALWSPVKDLSDYTFGRFSHCVPYPVPVSIPNLLIHWNSFSSRHKIMVTAMSTFQQQNV